MAVSKRCAREVKQAVSDSVWSRHDRDEERAKKAYEEGLTAVQAALEATTCRAVTIHLRKAYLRAGEISGIPVDYSDGRTTIVADKVDEAIKHAGRVCLRNETNPRLHGLRRRRR